MDSTFATVVNCMDGRVQAPVRSYLTERFDVDFVDTITEAGMVKYLSGRTDAPHCDSTLASIEISTSLHDSRQIAVVAHDGCLGNPESPEVQFRQLREAVAFLKGQFPDCEIVGLWVDASLTVHEMESIP